MVSASATFTVGSPEPQMPSVAPSVGGVINTNSSLNYPTYVPVSVPAPIPSKEAAITNVNMPTTVLPGASFSIIVSVTTYVAGTVNYVVQLQIPQLQLTQSSMPMTLSNMSVGTTTFNVSLPVTARGLSANGTVTGQLTLVDTTNNQTVDGVPLNFTIGGTSIPTGIGVVPSPVQPVPLGVVGRPVIGAVPTGPGALPIRAYQGYVFGRGGGRQRHQWDFMPHTLEPRRRYAYQGVLGVDYNLACSDQSVANGAGICANGTRAVVSPISQPPAPTVVAPAPPPPVIATPTDPTVTPASTSPPPPPTVTTPPITPVTTPTTNTVTPQVITPPTPLPPAPVDVIPHPTPTPTPPSNITNLPPFPTTNNREAWRDWAQQFRTDLRNWEQRDRDRGQGRGRGWAWGKNIRPTQHAYQASYIMERYGYQGQATSQAAVILTTVMGDNLHIDAHGLQPGEQVALDLNIPMSRVSKSTPLVADQTGHLAHDYKLSRPPGKQYIAAIRVTGLTSGRVGFKSLQI